MKLREAWRRLLQVGLPKAQYEPIPSAAEPHNSNNVLDAAHRIRESFGKTPDRLMAYKILARAGDRDGRLFLIDTGAVESIESSVSPMSAHILFKAPKYRPTRPLRFVELIVVDDIGVAVGVKTIDVPARPGDTANFSYKISMNADGGVA